MLTEMKFVNGSCFWHCQRTGRAWCYFFLSPILLLFFSSDPSAHQQHPQYQRIIKALAHQQHLSSISVSAASAHQKHQRISSNIASAHPHFSSISYMHWKGYLPITPPGPDTTRHAPDTTRHHQTRTRHYLIGWQWSFVDF